MAKADQTEIPMRIKIENPAPGVLYSLQTGDTGVLDPKRSERGEALRFDFLVRIASGPKFFGDQVRREGPTRRFVYIRIGQSAGDHACEWSRRMKIDIRDTPQDLLDRAMAGEGVVELTVDGTGKDGTPACATVKVTGRRIV
ncbi:MAG: hypothetical protein JSR79_13975 [Proteobacteria bacterium]|nr:hypothetical protein [Pseudomonadota bacterium]